MKATPLQQLILKLADKQDEHSFNTEYDDGVRRGLALAIVNARELLKEEKIYTREEVKNLIISVFLAKHNEGSDFIMQDWIKENLRTQNKDE